MNIIRKAERYDIDVILDLLKKYSVDSPLKLHGIKHNIEHAKKLLTYILLGQGIIFLGIKNNVTVGILIAIKQSNVWNPDIVMLQELAYYVLPDYRYTTIGYRLLKMYIDYATELVNNNNICGYTLSKMSTSPDLKYHKLGLEKIEETWLGQ